MRRLLAYAAIYLLWGGTYLAVRTVVLVTPPFSAAGARFFLSGVILLALAWRPSDGWPTRIEWVNSTKLGLVMFTINYACFFWAEQRLYSGVAAVAVSTMPVWIMLAELLLSRRRMLPVASVAGAVLGIAGVVLVTRGGTGVAASSQTGVAIVVLLTGTICWSFASVWSRKLVLPARQTTRAALQMATGGLMLGLLAIGAGEAPLLTAALSRWSWVTWACFGYLIAASILAFTAYVWLLHHEPANRVASYAYVNPLVALALGMGLAHEQISREQALGGGLVLLGVFSTLRGRSGDVGTRVPVLAREADTP